MIQIKRGLESSLSSLILDDGQFGYTNDTHKLKIGDGSTDYQNLPTFSTEHQYLKDNSIDGTGIDNFSIKLGTSDSVFEGNISMYRDTIEVSSYMGSLANLNILAGSINLPSDLDVSIHGLGAPTNPKDAENKNYVDTSLISNSVGYAMYTSTYASSDTTGKYYKIFEYDVDMVDQNLYYKEVVLASVDSLTSSPSRWNSRTTCIFEVVVRVGDPNYECTYNIAYLTPALNNLDIVMTVKKDSTTKYTFTVFSKCKIEYNSIYFQCLGRQRNEPGLTRKVSPSDNTNYLYTEDELSNFGTLYVPSKKQERLLWSGTAGAGAKIAVPNITDYSLLSVNIDGQGTSMFCRSYGSSFYGSGGSVNQSGPVIYVFGAVLDPSSEEITIRKCGSYDGNLAPLAVECSINQIYGII